MTSNHIQNVSHTHTDKTNKQLIVKQNETKRKLIYIIIFLKEEKPKLYTPIQNNTHMLTILLYMDWPIGVIKSKLKLDANTTTETIFL